MNRTTFGAIGIFALFCSPLVAQVPQLINYQGRVVVGTTNFDGTGQFRFALVNTNGSTTYWSNDGTSIAGSEPSNAVSLTVSKGLYSVLLGDTSVGNMTVAIPASVFNNSDVRLRVWFNDAVNGSQLLTPDQRIAAVGYAAMAANVVDGAITTAKIGNGAVASAQIANGAVTSAQIDSATVQSRITGTAATGSFITGINSNGTVTTGSQIWSLNGASAYYNGGNVGIGTSSPAVKLDINGSLNSNSGATFTGTNGDAGVITARRSGGDANIIIDATTASQNSILAYRKNNLSRWLMFADSTSESGSNAGSDFRLDAYGDAGAGIATRLLVKRSTGNVGIGTTSPAVKLDVNGSLNANSGATFTGTNGDGGVITARRSGGDAFITIDASPASQNSILVYRKNNLNRWLMFADNASESGGNVGSDFRLDAYNDTGGGIATRLIVKRGTGNVGIGTLAPVAKLQVDGSGGGYGTPAFRAVNTPGLAADFVGRVTVSESLLVTQAIQAASGSVTGSFSKGSGTFKIDHPLDPANKFLYHSFVESPDMMNVYNGNVTLDANGEATVQMPEWFESLNKDFRYQLTSIGAPGPNLYVAEEVMGNHFKIAGGTAGARVSWQVTGVRQDAWANAHRVQVEEEKPMGERGTYLHPELFGQPAPVTSGPTKH
ncbi:MAG: hypothetical protein QOG48_2194 [Verrucomicrobiota bacterium]|jgi:hypothetical protein